MPAVMRILGWKSLGLRCPDHDIDCTNSAGAPYRVTLIQMPNGTGKTTTLTLLRAALSGVAQSWDRDKVKQFQKKGSGANSGYFEVRLLLNGKRVTIVMNFDFENGRVRYKTTRGQGQSDGFKPPAEFRRFLNEDFVSFFVFDGELAQHLLDKAHTDAEAAVESLFQLNLFRTLEARVEEYWEKQTQNVTATEERGLSRRQNRLSKLRTRLKYLEQERQSLQDKKARLADELRQNREKYRQEISKEEERYKNLQRAESAVKDLESQVRQEAIEVLDIMRDPHAISSTFAQAMYELKTGLDRVKLPESAAREFFEELAEESECVCGTPINEEIRERIRFRAAMYLGSDDVSLLNSMKSAIQDAIGHSREAPEQTLNERLEQLQQIVGQERSARQELEALRSQAEQADPKVREARERIQQLEKDLSDVEQELAKFESKDEKKDDEETFGIEEIKKRIALAENKLAEISHTLELKSKRDVLIQILRDAQVRARSGISAELCAETNSRILQLMPDNNISVARIERSLVLQGQEGGSVGETLSVAYAFLSTLFHRSEHELPFVVDSPAGSIDLAVRPRIGQLIPKLTTQFIAFTISSERESFVQPLKKATDSEVQFITLFRKGWTGLEPAARASEHYYETTDGVRVLGESFFSQFQVDQEEAQ